LPTSGYSDTDINVGGNAADRLAVYGGDLKFTFGKIGLDGGYSKSDLQENTTNVNNQDDAAWYVNAKYDGGRWGLKGGYRTVEANYLAPGDWGQLGVLRNPTNIKGFNVGGHLDLGNALTLHAGGEWDKGNDDAFGPTTGFDTGTDINKWNVDLTYHVNPNLSLMVGYEDTEFTNLDPAVVATSLNGGAS